MNLKFKWSQIKIKTEKLHKNSHFTVCSIFGGEHEREGCEAHFITDVADHRKTEKHKYKQNP